MAKLEAVYLTGDGVEEPFLAENFETVVNYTEVRGKLDPKKHVVFFGSGTDISPQLYLHRPNRRTQSPHTIRDLVEASCWSEVILKSIANVGICRGAQLVCALNGGELFQHVDNHAGKNHSITFDDGRPEVVATSVHHQMMNLSMLKEEDYRLIAWSTESLSPVYLEEDDDTDWVPAPEKEPEIVWFPRSKSLAIQGHPEYMNPHAPFVIQSRELFSELILSQITA